ncbi:hypothetical protein LTR84_007526 [Exophiala bonariae]|uniref:Uncharacterized protein n=1 Tax=Exophiala bonariae TaxID=1690606 RepID=A0AAV9NKP4_9EURO|nr:hypothetical protein LTR84_007526 [Exophiala bonariae]
MNTSSAQVLLRACRPSSSRTLVHLPPSSSSSCTARAHFKTKWQLSQRQQQNRLGRPHHFSTSRATWNVQAETSTSTVTTTTAATPNPPAPDTEKSSTVFHEQSKPRGYEPDSYRVWRGEDEDFVKTSESFIGRVSRTGTMRKTVRVSRNVQVWDAHLQKYYTREKHALVHDPDDLLVEGDLVSYGGFPPSIAKARLEKGRPVDTKGRVSCCVFDVLTPFGSTVAQRVQARSSVDGAASVKLAS